jgi:hypothetical protein
MISAAWQSKLHAAPPRDLRCKRLCVSPEKIWRREPAYRGAAVGLRQAPLCSTLFKLGEESLGAHAIDRVQAEDRPARGRYLPH